MNWSSKIFELKSSVFHSMNHREFFTSLLSFCKDQSESSSEPSNNLTPNYVWSSLFKIASNDSFHLPFYFSLVKQYSLTNESFQDFESQEIEDALKTAENENDPLSKLMLMKPVIHLISLLPLAKGLRTFKLLIDVVEGITKQNENVPQSFIEVMEITECSTLNEEVLESYLDIVEPLIETEKSSAALIALSYFASSIIEALQDSTSNICEWAIKLLKSNAKNQIAALFLLQKAADSLSSNIEFVPQNLLQSILPLLISNNENVRIRAHKAARHLISSTVFYNKNAIISIISQFPEYSSITGKPIELFFALLQRFLDISENPQLIVIQNIFDFALNSIKNSSDSFIKAKSIECISEIASISKDYIEEVIDIVFKGAIELINENKFYTEVSNFLMILAQDFEGYETQAIDGKLEFLVNSIDDEQSGSKKQRLERAESLATILQTFNHPELINKIILFTTNILNSIVNGEIIYICALILAVLPQLQDEAASIIFKKLQDFAMKETDSIRLNAILHVLKEILEATSNPTIENYSSILINDISDGKNAYFNGLPIYTCNDEKTMIFLFIATYVRKLPSKSSQICVKMIESIPNVNYVMLPSILEPIDAALTAKILSKDDMIRISNVVIEALDKLLLDDDDQVIACIEVLSKISDISVTLIDTNKVLSILKQLLEGLNEDAQDTDKTSLLSPLFIIRLIYNISFYILDESIFDKDLLISATKHLPNLPCVDPFETVLSILTTKILPKTDVFGFLTVPGLTSISEILISNDYDISKELTNEMKGLLQKMIKENRSLERQITITFQKNRQKMNKFSKLLK